MNKLNYELKKYGIIYLINHILWKITKKTSYWINMENIKFKYIKSLNKEELKSEIADAYSKNTGDVMNWEHPENFNQKIQWLKLYDSTPIKTKLADKYLVKDWVKEKLHSDNYIVKTIGCYKNSKEINWDKLPDKFCLKANHGSGMNIVVKDKSKLDIKKASKTMDEWMNTPFGTDAYELQYLDIPRRIIAEKYIEQDDGDLMDYKIHCFNGKPEIIQVIGDRDLNNHTAKEAFFDTNWNRNDFMYHTYDSYEESPNKPEQLNEMLNVAKKISNEFIYVRVDLYIVKNQIKFGEMTFTPACGYGIWGEKKKNLIVGNMIKLPKINDKIEDNKV